jgi:hypothetical protein
MRRKRPGKNCRMAPVFASAGCCLITGISAITEQNQFTMPQAGRGTPLAW